MDYSIVFMFAAAVIAMQAAPGPVVAVVLSRALNRDRAGSLAFAGGVCLGQLVPIAVIALGFGVWIEGNQQWAMLFRGLGAAYMLWLAVQMWRATRFGGGRPALHGGWFASTGAGIAICLSSPYTFMFYVLMVPSVAPEGLTHLPSLAAIILVAVSMTAGTLAALMLLALQINRIITSPATFRAFNRTMAVLLSGISVALLVG